jgi:hypothetical protein
MDAGTVDLPDELAGLVAQKNNSMRKTDCHIFFGISIVAKMSRSRKCGKSIGRRDELGE